MNVKHFAKFIEYNIYMKVFADRLLELRKDKNLSQATLAKELGVSQVQVSRLETKILEKMRRELTSN